MLEKNRNSRLIECEEKLRLALSKDRGFPYSDKEWTRARQGLYLVDAPPNIPPTPTKHGKCPKTFPVSADETNQPMPLNHARLGSGSSMSVSISNNFLKVMEVIYYMAIVAIIIVCNIVLPAKAASMVVAGLILGVISIAGIMTLRQFNLSQSSE
ncbi:MAG: hypothetical protein AAF984_09350 [Verrucomicrobiota bacterium]